MKTDLDEIIYGTIYFTYPNGGSQSLKCEKGNLSYWLRTIQGVTAKTYKIELSLSSKKEFNRFFGIEPRINITYNNRF